MKNPALTRTDKLKTINCIVFSLFVTTVFGQDLNNRIAKEVCSCLETGRYISRENSEKLVDYCISESLAHNSESIETQFDNEASANENLRSLFIEVTKTLLSCNEFVVHLDSIQMSFINKVESSKKSSLQDLKRVYEENTLEFAVRLLENGYIESAQIVLENLNQKDSSDYRITSVLASVYEYKSNYDLASRLYDRCYQLTQNPLYLFSKKKCERKSTSEIRKEK